MAQACACPNATSVTKSPLRAGPDLCGSGSSRDSSAIAFPQANSFPLAVMALELNGPAVAEVTNRCDSAATSQGSAHLSTPLPSPNWPCRELPHENTRPCVETAR